MNIAVLLTCHNRKNKTISCLNSLFKAIIPPEYSMDVFLTDDGSTDGTAEAVMLSFPQVHVLPGNGSLYWAGGMRLAWETAHSNGSYDIYLLINDDVVLKTDFFNNLIKADQYSYSRTGEGGIYSGATVDKISGKISYGGSRVKDYLFLIRIKKLTPINVVQECDITNANILWVSKNVVDKIGIFDNYFTHGIADYDYSLQAKRYMIPVLLAPNVCGYCSHDHGKNWRNSQHPLKSRIEYLKSPKGLAYGEYMYFIKKFYPAFLPYAFIMLWLKTLFPFIWDNLKK